MRGRGRLFRRWPTGFAHQQRRIDEYPPLWEVPTDEFASLIDVNVKGTFHVVRAFVPAMVNAARASS